MPNSFYKAEAEALHWDLNCGTVSHFGRKSQTETQSHLPRCSDTFMLLSEAGPAVTTAP